MRILTAEFIKSAYTEAQLAVGPMPQIAFCGRSNVGKSSLINCLLNRRGLAKTSATPGRTQAVNFIRVNGSFHFVDLPGYGYAKVPHAMRRKLSSLIQTYLEQSACLRLVVLIVDCRRAPADDELLFVDWLRQHDIAVLAVLTKVDKLKANGRQKSRAAWKHFLGTDTIVPFSATTGEGKTRLWKEINAYLHEKASY